MAKSRESRISSDTRRPRRKNRERLHPEEPQPQPSCRIDDHVAQLEAVLESVEEGLLICDAAGCVLRMNRRALEIHGYGSVADAWRTLSEYAEGFELFDLEGHSIPVEDGPLSRAIRGEMCRELRVRIRNKRTGREWIGHCSGTPVQDERGQVVLVVLSLRELKRPADQAVEELARLARIPQENPDPVFCISAEYVLLYSNPAGQELCRRWGCRIGERVPAAVRAIVSAALADGAVAQHAATFGSRTYWLTVAPSIADGYVNIYARDITDHERAREALRQAEQRFRTILDNTSDGVFLLDLEARKFTMCNKSCLQMLGYTEQEFMKLSVADIHPEADLPFIYAQIEEFLKGGKPIRHDIRFKRKDGSILLADVSPDLIRLEGRRYVVVALKDITERKQAEESLAESERKYRSLVENIPDVTWTTDREGHTLFISPNVRDVYGYSAEEICAGGNAWLENVHPDDRPRMEAAFHELFTQKKRYDIEYRIRRRDGTWIWLHDRSVSSYEKDGQWYADGVFSDVTERKRMEDELRQYAEHQEELVAARTRELQESEAGLAAAQRLAHLGSWQWSVGTDTASWSEETFRIFDIAPGPLQRHREDFLSRIVPEDRQCVDQALADALSGARDYDLDYRITLPDGRERVIHAQAQVLRSSDGRPVMMHGTVQDITERKRAQEALQEKEYLLSESQRIGHIGTWSVDPASDAVTWTSETYRLFGVSPETFVPSADALIGLLHPDDRGAMRESMRAMSAGEHVGVLEFRVTLGDGSVRVLSGRGEMIFADGNRPVRLVGTVQDVTEQKQAQAALLESEERYRILLEHGFDGIFVHEDFRIVQLNDRLAEMTGYTREELMGSNPIDMFLPESQERIRQYIRSGATGSFEIELRRRDGRIVEVESFGVPCRFHGRNARIVGFRDITERKRAQEALRESEERFRAAFEEGAVGMALTALDSTLLKVNSSFCRMLGFSESDLVGRSYTEITHPDDLAENLVGTRRLASGEISSFRMEKRYIRKDGAVVWGDMNTASVRDANGRPLYCVTHVQDVTDRKQAEEALRGLNERLELQVAQRTEDLRRTVGRLRQLTLELSQAEDRERKRIADILHEDVQQTLAAARFHLNLLDSETCGAKESQAIIQQVRQMLRDAIDRSRSLSHELSPAMYQVELMEILSWLARHMQQTHGLTVRVEGHGQVDSPSEPLKAFLYKVTQELLFNVVKHAGVSEARVRVRRMGQSIYLSVVDRGRGFDPRELEGAAGFGLLSIRERVQLLGGRMKIRSMPSSGSRVLIAVPDPETLP